MEQKPPIVWHIPKGNSQFLEIRIPRGGILFIVGHNGSGKSALIQHLSAVFRSIPLSVKRIVAHRQNWFPHSAVSFTPAARLDWKSNFASYEARPDSRWKAHGHSEQVDVALFDLFEAERRADRDIAMPMRLGDVLTAKEKAKDLPPISQLNDLLQRGALTAQIRIGDNGVFLAQHGDGNPFDIERLSDGERSAVILATEVLTAEQNTIFLIDEPERHLHRGIIEPLLSALFSTRPDCTFVIGTHEIALPAMRGDGQVLLLRGCKWGANEPFSWDIDLLESDSEIPEDLKSAILGARRKILFVEGTSNSLDRPLYMSLFSDLTIIPVGGCVDVIRAVDGLRGAGHLHWLATFGLIDRDDRNQDEIISLSEKGIFALNMCSIEALFYSEEVMKAVADQQAKIFDEPSGADMYNCAKDKGLEVFQDEEILVRLSARKSERIIRNSVLSKLPKWKDVQAKDVEITIPSPLDTEIATLKGLIRDKKLHDIINRYPARESSVFSEITKVFKFRNRGDYERSVLSLIQRDNQLRDQLKKMLEPFSSTISSIKTEETKGTKG